MLNGQKKKERGRLILGIDASRCRSGGAIAHLLGILESYQPNNENFTAIHLWAPTSVLNAVADVSWLHKHNLGAFETSLFRQLIWQMIKLKIELVAAKCDILFTVDASTLCNFTPQVVLSQDMLSYEPGVMRHYGWSKARLRLILILYVQNLAFRRASGVIFLTRYSGQVIQKSCGNLANVAFIPHGIGVIFKSIVHQNRWGGDDQDCVRCLYVSNAEMYKNQWVVVEAISLLRSRGHNVTLSLIGGGQGPAQKLLQDSIAAFDPDGSFVKQYAFLPHASLPQLLATADLFVFASSCENMPVTLVEAMAVGLPIACSNRGPMPGILNDGGVYFDPEDAGSIAEAVEQIIQSPKLRLSIAHQAKALSLKYSWERCANETFAFIAETFMGLKK